MSEIYFKFQKGLHCVEVNVMSNLCDLDEVFVVFGLRFETNSEILVDVTEIVSTPTM